MNIRTLFNLVLFAVATLLAFIVFYEPGVTPEPEQPPLTSMAPESIQTIRRLQEKREELQLEQKEEGAWFVTAPIQAPVKPDTLEVLLHLPETPSYSQYPVEDMELSRIGLESPEVRLYLNDLAIDFGGTEPLSQRRYVLVEDTVHLIDDNAFYTIASNAARFIDTALLPGNKTITRLQLPRVTGSIGNPKVSPKHTLTVRREEDTWVSEGFEEGPNEEVIPQLVEAWQQTKAEQVELRGDGVPLTTIEVQRENEAPIQFELLSTLPRLVLARPDFGVQYRLPASAWKSLFQLIED